MPNYIDFSLHTHGHVSTDEVNILSSAVNEAKELGVQFIDPVETIICDTHGHEYYNTRHDVGVRIPEAAILPSDGMIKIEFGVAMYGPFKITDRAGLKRVSPVVWLCIQQDGFSGFQKDLEITIPHFLQLSTEDAHKYLQFLKADHQLEDGEKKYQFKSTDARAVYDHVAHGTLLMRHFCSVCIATQNFPNQRTKYYLGGGISLKGQDCQIIFYVCYFLKSCVRVRFGCIKCRIMIEGSEHTGNIKSLKLHELHRIAIKTYISYECKTKNLKLTFNSLRYRF